MSENNTELIIYQTEDGTTKIDVHMENETVWLSLDQMAELFQRDKSTISKHIKNIFNEGELERGAVVANFATTATDGKTYHVDYYNLDVIISVGYRVKSKQGTRFRQWANQVLKDYLLKGYSINHRLQALERTVADHSQKIDFFVRTALPPIEGIFYNGQIFDAYDVRFFQNECTGRILYKTIGKITNSKITYRHFHTIVTPY